MSPRKKPQLLNQVSTEELGKDLLKKLEKKLRKLRSQNLKSSKRHP